MLMLFLMGLYLCVNQFLRITTIYFSYKLSEGIDIILGDSKNTFILYSIYNYVVLYDTFNNIII